MARTLVIVLLGLCALGGNRRRAGKQGGRRIPLRAAPHALG